MDMNIKQYYFHTTLVLSVNADSEADAKMRISQFLRNGIDNAMGNDVELAPRTTEMPEMHALSVIPMEG